MFSYLVGGVVRINCSVLCCVATISLPTVHARELPKGVVATPPPSGRVVATDGVYLVPYEEKIPGTDVSFRMIAVPGGTFLLGSPPDEAGRRDDEGPQVEVAIPPFWIAEHEVNWAMYRPFMNLAIAFDRFEDAAIRQLDDKHDVDAVTAPSKLYDPSFTFQSGEEPELPAITMSQYAAKQYTKWLSLLTERFYRLPTEAEWEYACRAGTTTAYSFGDDASQLDDYAWHYENSDDVTHPVGQKKPNPWGLYDMHGNVEEWVLDAYDAEFYSRVGKSASRDEAINWPTRLFPRVLRGGSWEDDPDRLRSAARNDTNDDDLRDYDPNEPKSPWWFASDASQDIGFRIVRPYYPPAAEVRGKYWDADVPSIQEVADYRIDKEGRGERGRVDPQLPEAIRQLEAGQ